VGDCNETLVANGDFKANVNGWTFGETVVMAWSALNGSPDAPSGSASVTAVGATDQDGLTQAAAVQCIPVPGGAQLELRASAFIRSGQGDGVAVLGLWFHEQPDCMGTGVSPVSAGQSLTDTWLTLKGSGVAPTTAVSVLVRLAVTKPHRTPAFEILFDNVLVRTK
jgi:hypothetical protein